MASRPWPDGPGGHAAAPTRSSVTRATDSNPARRKLRKRRILPDISRKGAPNIKGLGKLRYVVEQTLALLHQFKRLAVRWERRTALHDAFASLAWQPHLLETPQEGSPMIVLRALKGCFTWRDVCAA